jgi:hypothetical protein
MSTPPRPHLPFLARGVGRALGVGVGLLLVVALLAAPALAQATSPVGGVVLTGTDESPIADVPVALVTTEAGEAVVLAETVSDDDGAFAFVDAPRGAEVEVVASYADATYRSGLFEVSADGNTDLEVLVYETTEDPANVRITTWVVWIDHEAGVTIQQDLQVENDSELTWLGGAPDADGTRPVLTVPLHAAAEGLGFLGRFTECCATMQGTSYVHTSPLLPGRTMGTVRYSVETLETLELPLTLPVESLTVMLPPGVEVTAAEVAAGVGGDGAGSGDGDAAAAAALTEAGQIESRGTEYSVHVASDLAAGQVVRLGFDGLDDGSTPLWWYALSAVVGLLVVAGAVWWLRRRRSPVGRSAAERRAIDHAPPPDHSSPARVGRSAAHERSIDHGTAAIGVTPDVTPDATPAGTPTDGRASLPADLLVEELALLDLGVERGFVSREVYEQLRAARLAELLAQASTTGQTSTAGAGR